jgi:hypothetical protein
MKNLISLIFVAAAVLTARNASAQAKVMNPGEGIGQLVVLTSADVISETPKFKQLNPISIPVFDEFPTQLSVIMGAVTLRQQNFNSHVQLKAIALQTPNLDISQLEGGLSNPLFQGFKDGDWIHMKLTREGGIEISAATEQQARDFYDAKVAAMKPVTLQSNLEEKRIRPHGELSSKDFVSYGSKAANYAELVKILNTDGRTVTRPGFAIPFYYYQEFLDLNPDIKDFIEKMVRDPFMRKVEKAEYRATKLETLRNMMNSPNAKMNKQLSEELVTILDTYQSPTKLPRNMKFRSSTNSEDLPNFNGAGLYDSKSYKPVKKSGKVRKHDEKIEEVEEVLKAVWSSVWTARAYEERSVYRIPHLDVKMGIQVNLSFSDEGADGVVVTKNILRDPSLLGDGVYIESQRGEKYSVTNPDAGIAPERILVLIDRSDVFNKDKYSIQVIGRSNVADNGEDILPGPNPNPVMSDDELKDLVYQSLKAEAALKAKIDKQQEQFTLDLEFKVDSEDTDARQVYIKQARPYLD